MGKKYLLSCLIVLLAILSAWSQEQEDVKPAIKVIAFPYNDSIAVRWAPTTPVAWQLCNKYGFYVERITITRNNKVIPPEKIKLFNEPLKPWSGERWERLIDHNDFAAIAAQAIYGDSFESTNNYSSDVLQVINLAKELEQRHSFALLAADLSRITATASALGFVDKYVKRNEKYLYKIFAAVPHNYLKIDTGFVFMGIADRKDLPKPIKLTVVEGDKAVMLSWARNYYDDIYVAYRVERSDDGKNFKPITKLPIINTDVPKGLPADKVYKLDSLTENNKKFYYRVIGLTPFGDEGPSSDLISAIGVKPFEVSPAVVRTRIENNERVMLQWTFPEGLKELKGFNILRSKEADNGFEKINNELQAPAKRDFIDLKPLSTNYYRVEAVGHQNQRSMSFSNLVMLEDSIPPVAPKGVKASVTDKGIVMLSWDSNSERDLLGYRVFRANYKEEEFSQVTSSPIGENLFQDTISVQTLTDKVYYKVAAVDNRYNTSSFSEVLELKRPDVVPPSPALFKGFRATDAGIILHWVSSPSEDVIKYELWRKDKTTKTDMLLKEFRTQDTTRTYFDDRAVSGVSYEYVLYTFDNSGFKVPSAQPLQLKRPHSPYRSSPENVKAEADRINKLIKLTWQYSLADVEKINIYRAKEDEPITLLRTSTGNLFQDKDIQMNVTYRYRVQAVFKNGVQSKLSDEVAVKF